MALTIRSQASFDLLHQTKQSLFPTFAQINRPKALEKKLEKIFQKVDFSNPENLAQQLRYYQKGQRLLLEYCGWIDSVLIEFGKKKKKANQFRLNSVILFEQFNIYKTQWLKELKLLNTQAKTIEKKIPVNERCIDHIYSTATLYFPSFKWTKSLLKKMKVVKQPHIFKWQFQTWGHLLLPHSVSGKVETLLGLGFCDRANRLISKVKSLSLSIEQTDKKKSKIKKLQGLQRKTHLLFLLRLIEKIGSWNRFIVEARHLGENGIKIAQMNVELLNREYYRRFNRYRALPAPNCNVLGLIVKEGVHAVTLGMIGKRYVTIEELRHRKILADQGYCARKQLKAILQMKINREEGILAFISKEIDAFSAWAKRCPRKASNIVANLALAFSILAQGKGSFLDHLKTAVTAKAYVASILTHLHAFPETEVQPEELRFQAIASLAYLAPLASAALSTACDLTFESGTTAGIIEIALKFTKKMLTATALQSLCAIIPEGRESIALALVQVLKGDEFHQILEHQRNLALIQIGCLAKQAFGNRGRLFHKIKKGIVVNVHAILKAGWKEKIARIVFSVLIPAGIILASIGLVAASISSGVITLPFALLIGGVLLTGTFLITREIVGYIDSKSEVKARVRDDYLERQQHRLAKRMRKLLSNDEGYQEKLVAERDNYIKDLQKHYVIPRIPDEEQMKEDNPLIQQVAENKIQTTVHSLMTMMDDHLAQNIHDPGACVRVYKETINLESITQQLETAFMNNDEVRDSVAESDIFLAAEKATYRLSKKLQEEWLLTRLDKAFIQQCITMTLRHTDQENYMQFFHAKSGAELPQAEVFLRNFLEKEHCSSHLTQEILQIF